MRDIAAGRRVRLRYQQYTRAYREGTATVLSYDRATEIYTLERDANTTARGNPEPVIEDDWPQHHVSEVDHD